MAELNHGHDVQHPIDTPVPGPGQAMTALFTRGRFDRGGTVPRREMPRGREPGDVSDVAEKPGGAGRADPVELLQGTARLSDEFDQLDVRGFDLLVDHGEFGDQLAGQLSAGTPD